MMLENDLWLLEQHSRSLQECRRDIAWVWDDEAARELNRRYLDPHTDDDEELRKSLHEVIEQLSRLSEAISDAEDAIQVAEDRAERVARELGEMDREMTEAERARMLAMSYVDEVDDVLPKIAELLANAENACP